MFFRRSPVAIIDHRRRCHYRGYSMLREYRLRRLGHFHGNNRYAESQAESQQHAPTSIVIDTPSENRESKECITVDGEIIPEEPKFPDNCCMSVLDIYQEEVEEWKAKINDIRDRLLREGKPLPPILAKQQSDMPQDDVDPGLKALMELEKKLAAQRKG
ncbi:584_t:CDS:2 [Paraglomus occultum]|uniref:584_t:CDS:1 n=1 Tax=Paraglomus occultum TaxID=144539 RepID=A0A9N9B0L2_9GLOM|nr:584_t:CDS:2 [Paraglomus occultum]